MPDQPFGLGPAWARGTTCCGKPVGCTNMSGQCLMTGHPWKRRNVARPGDNPDPGTDDDDPGSTPS